tara:strand:- start:96 stop:305 length:210 start_codon:yes stop_codon:yes gene_type:complete
LLKSFHTFVNTFETLNVVDELELGVALTLTLPEFISASNDARDVDVVFIVPNSDKKTLDPSCRTFKVVR